jgi:hypothetical protein
VWRIVRKRERQRLFERVEESLRILQAYVPVRFAQFQKDVASILIAGDPTFHGQYIKELKLIELYDDHVSNPATTVEELGSILVHEAQHARLFRLGFGYEEALRNRIEKLCFRSEKIYGLRIPCGERVVENADAWLQKDLADFFSNQSRREVAFKTLDELGCPRWLQGLLRKYIK